MAFRIDRIEDLGALDVDTIIDVRSPSEFAEDHLPGAINLPVLDDDERARVGTIYKQESAFRARKIGAALVSRNAARHIEGPLADNDGGWRPLIYCWRGGQRSGSFAAILSQIGWRVELLEGGYRAYRRAVSELLYDRPFAAAVVLLDGNTGTAKTELLGRLSARGVQVIDLEGLANHRGSALGARGEQPSQKAFETALAAEIAALDPARPVVLEAESSRIGRLTIPPRVFEAMKPAPRLEIAAPLGERAAYLARAYSDIASDPAALAKRLGMLTRLQGRERVARWIGMAGERAFEALAAELIELHYDPSYRRARTRSQTGARTAIEIDRLDATGQERLADRIAAEIDRLAASASPAPA